MCSLSNQQICRIVTRIDIYSYRVVRTAAGMKGSRKLSVPNFHKTSGVFLDVVEEDNCAAATSTSSLPFGMEIQAATFLLGTVY